MDENFSPRVKDVISYSKEEAIRLGHGLSCGVKWKIHSFHFSVIRSGDTLVNGFNESGRWSAVNLKKLEILKSSDSLHYYQITIIDFRGKYVELKPMRPSGLFQGLRSLDLSLAKPRIPP